MKRLFASLGEKARRRLAAVEVTKLGHCGVELRRSYERRDPAVQVIGWRYRDTRGSRGAEARRKTAMWELATWGFTNLATDGDHAPRSKWRFVCIGLEALSLPIGP